MASLITFGPPLFVTDDDEWRLAGFDGSQADQGPRQAVVVAHRGALDIRTGEPPELWGQPRYADVRNVRAASLNRPGGSTLAEQSQVLAVDDYVQILLDGESTTVRVLRSRQTLAAPLVSETFRFRLTHSGRSLSVAGHLSALTGLRIRSLADFG